jgi:Spy/CpxP family protein refolding chaperone
MKPALFKYTLASIALFSCILFSENAMSQNRPERGGHFPSREAIVSQKIAFITKELQLTNKEAEKFWPVYNSAVEKMHNTHKASARSLRALNQALEDNSSSETDIKVLAETYINCKGAEHEVYTKLYEEISTILPVKKAAKIFQAEENFRVMLIKQLRQCKKEKED